MCPFRSRADWQRLKDTGNGDWTRAVEIDRAVRYMADGMTQYVHADSCHWRASTHPPKPGR
jgi:hypothetical protein